MSPLAIGFLAIGLSVDAFIAAIGNGATERHPGFARALRTGLVFGAVEAVTPLLGWCAGMLASGYVEAIDHWIAFTLLLLVGGRMALHGWRDRDLPAPARGRQSPLVLLATAVGTSVDAAAVGISLAFLQVSILTVALVIGLVTAVMATVGVMFGRVIGSRFGHIAEMAGGIVLMLLGSGILLEHLTH